MTDIERKLEEAGLILPTVKASLGAYVPVIKTGAWLYISGQGPVAASGSAICGRLGEDLDIEDGSRAAQICALNIIAHLKHTLSGDWSQLKQIVRVGGYVNSTPDFTHQPAVLNGASELMHCGIRAGTHQQTSPRRRCKRHGA